MLSRAHFVLYAIFSLVMLLGFSCGGDDDDGTGGFLPPEDSTLEITMNGEAFDLPGAASFVDIPNNPSRGLNIVAGINDRVTMTIAVLNYQGPGTYPIGLENVPLDGTTRAAGVIVVGSINGEQVAGADTATDLAGDPGGSGRIVIDEVTDFTISGTLEFTAYGGRSDGNGNYLVEHTVQGTGGSFQLNRAN